MIGQLKSNTTEKTIRSENSNFIIKLNKMNSTVEQFETDLA